VVRNSRSSCLAYKSRVPSSTLSLIGRVDVEKVFTMHFNTEFPSCLR
jgi:hypothetical protein